MMKPFFKAIGVLCALMLLTGLVVFPVTAKTKTAVAKVSASAPTVQRGKTTLVAVRVAVASRYHVNSNPATEKSLIPTSVKLTAPKGFKVGKARYPKGKMKSFAFTKKPISVYDGTTVIRVPVTVPRTAKTGTHNLTGTVRYQACDDKNCLMPVNAKFTVKLRVK